MSNASIDGIDALTGMLATLYGDAQANRMSDRILELVDRYRSAVSEFPPRAPLSERDVVLITYADTLSDPDDVPLDVLRRFHGDYLEDVCDSIHILPFHPYSSDDGFSVIDYHAVRDDLGNWDDVVALGRECTIMADAVVNHMSAQSPWFARFLANDDDYAEFFVEADPDADFSNVVRPRTSPLLTRFEDADGRPRFVWTTFSADQVDLNYRNPDVLIAIVDVLMFLVSKGAGLLRLDAVTFLWKEDGTSCANLPQTHLLIKIMRKAVSLLRTDVVIITETNVPHRENVAYFGDGHDEAHAVYNFALPPLVAHSFIGGDAGYLSGWARDLTLPSDDVCFLNFSASHDGVGVRAVEEILSTEEVQRLVDASKAAGGKVSSRALGDGKERPYELNCTYLDLISRPDDDAPTTVSRFIASQSVVLAMPGIPAVYIQSLLGTRNDHERFAETGRARSLNRSHHQYGDVVRMLADRDRIEAQIFDRLTGLIRLRRAQAGFDPFARFEVRDFGRPVFAIERGDRQTGTAILCLVNVSGDEVPIVLASEDSGNDLISGDNNESGNHVLRPYDVRWISLGQQQ